MAPSLHPALYDAVITPVERMGLRAERSRLLAAAAGRVLEVGAGTGLSLAHYPPAVTSVVALEPDAALRRRLSQRARDAPVPVTVLPLGVPGAGLGEATFDTVVCVLVLCTVADAAAGIAELRRLVAPGGSLLFLEHVRGRRVMARLQRIATPAWSRVAGGCELDRDTVGALRAGGFVITDLDRLAPLGRLTAGSVVRGRAIPRLSTPTEGRHER